MKRLLLLLIFSPVILLAQTRGKDIIDTNEVAAINIKSMAGVIGYRPCSKVTEIHITHNITDSGKYTTTVVFFHNLTALDSADFDTVKALLPLAAKISTKDIAAHKMEMVAGMPPLPIIKDDSLTALRPIAFVKINTEDIVVDKLEIVATMPPLPDVVEYIIKSLLPHAIVIINTDEIAFGRLELETNLPRLPVIKDDSLTALRAAELTDIHIADIAVAKLEVITALPPLPDIKEGEMTALLPHDMVKISTAAIPMGKVEIVDSIPDFEPKKMPVEGMHLSAEGYSLLEKLEGYSEGLYSLNDGGYTIGFGFFVPFNEGYKWKNGVTWEEAERIIQQKVPTYEDQVKEFINVPLTQREFDALTMLAYNLGGFAKATSIVNDINNQEDFDKLQSDWRRFVHSKAPNVSKGLMNRRKDELEVREKSEYQAERKIQVLKSRKS